MSVIVHRGLLAGLRRWFRLTSLFRDGATNFEVVATLNPAAQIATGDHDAGTETDYLHWRTDRALPPVKAPDFQDGILTSGFRAEYLNEKFAGLGQYAGQRTGEPIGFQYIVDHIPNNDNDSERWSRTHLLARELGGSAKHQNLVPARQYVNMAMRRTEAPAAAHIESGQDIVWYDVRVQYHDPRPETGYPGNQLPRGFPASITVSWGRYELLPGKRGEKRKHWRDLGTADTLPLTDLEEPPKPTDTNPFNINKETVERIQRVLFVIPSVAEDIHGFTGVKPQTIDQVIERLKAAREGRPGHPFAGYERLRKRLQELKKEKRLLF
ncbi:DNA/RNA non-specific endonuclease [Streptomyces hainanensis]|uniref:Type VII secretion system protein EssD-like domain-containing protein n=1 Tax=Streptomyces hainanensis TaxID=402648 RepID=A0A4R4TPM4_9ACTN|nr:DNA/RNA non-specific endonuclease [Streptomyces hainanensis]TDC77262.1 hypothetical protein E1283_07720 [Streptomyces hainanensis]